jgi:uncharacterized damage-inducible protein DinB
MKTFFLRFFAFNNWANDLIIRFLIKKQIQDEEIIRLMSHVAHAERNWYYRASRQQNDVPVWNNVSLDAIARSLHENGKLWIEFVESQSEESLLEKLPYKNMGGKPNLNTLSDVLTHLVNHSTYHRGQVIYLIRALGIAPPGTDFIQYARLF